MRICSTISAVALAAALAACSTTQPIQNVDQAVVTNVAGKPLSREQVHDAIVRAGNALGWKMTDESPDRLVGSLQLRRHLAVVEIPYSATGYAIKYRSSINLDEKDGKIHRNYNSWIQNLNLGITGQLSAS